MPPLNDDEERQLSALLKKRKAPAGPAVGKNLSISIDLGDDEQVKRAQRLGLLDGLDDDDDDGDEDQGDDDQEDDDADERPRRRGFFDG